MKSIWSTTTTEVSRPKLTQDIKTNTVIIGGGMAGILIGHYLQESGIDNVILEASKIGSGVTQNTTAKITSQHGLKYNKLITTLGKERALQYANTSQEAVSEYVNLIGKNNIDCQMEKCPAYIYSIISAKAISEEAEAAKILGINSFTTTQTNLPFKVISTLGFENQWQFHPLLFLKSIAKDLTIYEDTPAIKVNNQEVITPQGTVKAKNIIFATHYPFINFPGYYFIRMYQERSYVLALRHAAQLDGMYIGIDSTSFSFRNSGEYLLLGGGKHHSGENSHGGRYSLLRQKAAEWWPESKEIATWSAQDAMTLDDVPYIGKFSTTKPNWYVATGFGKWGMTSSMVSAMLLRDLIIKKDNSNTPVFSPQRFTPRASYKNLLFNSAHAASGLLHYPFAPASNNFDKLPPNHGTIMRQNGKKVGVHKDKDEQIFMVSAKCPHLGCQLTWNQDEKSWDCPCHGSRFDYLGNLIGNPSQKDIKI